MVSHCGLCFLKGSNVDCVCVHVRVHVRVHVGVHVRVCARAHVPT